jgi:hypothetical protein
MDAASTLLQVNAAQRYVPGAAPREHGGNTSHTSTTSTLIPPNWC